MKNKFQRLKFRMQNLLATSFQCPICSYKGPFQTARPNHPLRRLNAICPRCGSAERQRVQWFVVQKLLAHDIRSDRKLLHFAPEPHFREQFQSLFQQVTTCDLNMSDVDVKADVCDLPFPDQSFDVVFISHVLEHVREDQKAAREIRRVLRPKGMAIVEVPITMEQTVEYDEPNPHEFGHVRAPGPDYYDRFTSLFTCCEKIVSEDVPPQYQPYIYCDWTRFPTPQQPHRRPVQGRTHPIVIAVYYA